MPKYIECLNESCILELMPTWNCFSSAKLHIAVREGTGRRVGVTLDFEAAAVQPPVCILCTTGTGTTRSSCGSIFGVGQLQGCKIVQLLLQRQELEATLDFEATDPRSDKSGSSAGGQLALLARLELRTFNANYPLETES